MNRRIRTSITTRVDLNKDRIYRLSDIHDVASLVYPNKNATDLRAAFILIFVGIKYSRERKLTSSEIDQLRLEKAPVLSQKTLWKARATMARLGIIERKDMIYWKLSSRFSKSLTNFAGKVEQMMTPNGLRNQHEKEWYLLDHALAMCDTNK